MKKKIVLSVLTILAVAAFCFSIILMVIYFSDSSVEYESEYSEKITGVWTVTKIKDYKNNEYELSNESTFEFTSDSKVYIITLGKDLIQGEIFWKTNEQLNCIISNDEQVYKFKIKLNNDNLIIDNKTKKEIYEFKKWENPYPEFNEKIAGKWYVSSAKLLETGKILEESIGEELIFENDGTYINSSADATSGTYRPLDETTYFLVKDGIPRIATATFIDGTVNIIDSYYGTIMELSQEKKTYVSYMNEKLIGTWNATESRLLSTMDIILIPSTSFTFNEDFTFSVVRENKTIVSGQYEWIDDNTINIISNISRNLKIEITDDYLLKVEDALYNQVYFLTFKSDVEIQGMWKVNKIINLDTNQEIDCGNKKFNFDSSQVFSYYDNDILDEQISSEFRWISNSQFVLLNSKNIYEYKNINNEHVIIDQKNNLAYYIEKNKFVSPYNSILLKKWIVLEKDENDEFLETKIVYEFTNDFEIKVYQVDELIQTNSYYWFDNTTIVYVNNKGESRNIELSLDKNNHLIFMDNKYDNIVIMKEYNYD